MLPDRPPLLAEPMSRRRVLAIGGAALLSILGLSVGGVDVVRRSGVLGAARPAPAAVTSASTSGDADSDEPWPPPPLGLSPNAPTEFLFSVDRGVSASDERLLRDAAVLARDFYHRTFGAYLTNKPRVRFTTSRAGDALGDANSQSVRIYLGHPAWPRLSDADKIHVVCHEVFHLMQATLSRGWYPYPVYLLEGAAEYAGQATVIDAGLRSRAEFLSTQLRLVRRFPQPTIGEVDAENRGGNYAIGALAVDQLVGARGMAPLGHYFRLLSETAGLGAAFEAAFAESRPAFEVRFERWRAENGIAAQ